jgi:hypothetical protein
VLTIIQAAKMMTNPITTDFIIPVAWLKSLGLAPAKKNITPPKISIKTAITGTKTNNNFWRIVLIRTKIWQNWQADSPVPPQGTSPAACTWPKIKKENKKVANNIFFIILIVSPFILDGKR